MFHVKTLRRIANLLVIAVFLLNAASIAPATARAGTAEAPPLQSGGDLVGPASLTAAGQTDSTIDLSWEAASGGTGSIVYDIFEGENRIGLTADTVFVALNLPPGTSHTFTVVARDEAGATAPANETATAATLALEPCADCTLAPTGPELPSLLVDLEVSPDPIKVGETAAFSLTLTNQGAAAHQVSAILPLPSGVVPPVDDPHYDAASGSWQWTADTLDRGSSLTFTTALLLQSMPPGQALVARARVATGELPFPVQAVGGALALGPSVKPGRPCVDAAPTCPTATPPAIDPEITPDPATTTPDAAIIATAGTGCAAPDPGCTPEPDAAGPSATPAPVEATATAASLSFSLAPAGTAPVEVTPTPAGAGITLLNDPGDVGLSFTSEAGPQALTLAYLSESEALDSERALPPQDPSIKSTLRVFFLDALDGAGARLQQFDQPLTLSVGYTPEQLEARGIAESDLTLFRYDTAQAAWIPLESFVDPAALSVSAAADAPGPFQLSDGSSPSEAFLPSVKGWQVSTFTGAASFALPIEVPAGPAGLKPDLQLRYSSAAADGKSGLRKLQQASWVGKGWSLAMPFIAANKVTNDTYYALSLNGQSYDMVRGASIGSGSESQPDQWTWHSTDEAFIRMRAVYVGLSDAARGGFNSGVPERRYKWQVWTKDGTLYEFAEDLWWGWQSCNPAPEGDGAYMEAYKWMLSRVVDTHGSVITYGYQRDSQSKESECAHASGVVDRDIWPVDIYWSYDGTVPGTGSPRYQVHFNSVARPFDQQFDAAPAQLGGNNGVPRETRELDSVQVFSKRAGTWELVRQYNFNIDYSLFPDVVECPTPTTCKKDVDAAGNPLHPKPALRSITQAGKNGTAFPITMTFTYGTSVNANSKYPPGDFNRLIRFDNGQGGTVSFAYDNIGVVLGSNNDAFVNYRRVRTRTVTDGRNNTYTWNYAYGTPALNTLGRTLNGKPNDPSLDPNSADQYLDKYLDPLHDSSDQLVHKPLTEFRGHDFVTETDPLLNQTTHYFYQGQAVNGCHYPGWPGAAMTGAGLLNDPCFLNLRDSGFLVGREYRTDVRAGANTLVKQVLHGFGVSFYDYGPQRPTGLWHAFAFETRTDEKTFDGTAALVKTTEYFYDAANQQNGVQLGNVTRIRESINGSPYRITQRWYNTLNGGVVSGAWGPYIVDRLWRERVEDPSGAVLSQTHYFYYTDAAAGASRADNNQIGRRGLLWRVSASVSCCAYPIALSDTTYAYDAYGNQTQVSTFAGHGQMTSDTAWSAPGGGSAASRTTTEYDGVFHAFPTVITNPLSHEVQAGYDFQLGTLTSVTDANNQVTSATYDAFGRMTLLIKPGDSSGSPTVKMAYRDTAPVRYKVEYKDGSPSGGTRVVHKFYDGLGREIQVKSEAVFNASNIVVDRQYDGLGRVIRESQPHYQAEDAASFEQYTSPGSVLWTQTAYDVLGRPVLTTYPDATKTTQAYGVYQDSALGWLHWHVVVDPNHHLVEYFSDPLDRLVKVTEFKGNCPSTATWGYPQCGGAYTRAWAPYADTLYTYNRLDLLTQVRDAAANLTTIAYDSLGRKTSMTDPDMGAWAYVYDGSGNLTRQKDARGKYLCFYYDSLNRLKGKQYNDTNAACPANLASPTLRYTYDQNANGIGRLATMVSPDETTSLTYDGRGRKIQAAHTVAGLTRTFRWSYDSADRITSIIYPTNETVTYTYDAAWRPYSLCSSLGGCLVNSTTYSALNQPMDRRLGSGLIQQWAYTTPMQRLFRLILGPGSTPNSLLDRAYAYDSVGNITKIQDAYLNQTQNFAYDDLNRLERAWSVTGLAVAPGTAVQARNLEVPAGAAASLLAAGPAPDLPGAGHVLQFPLFQPRVTQTNTPTSAPPTRTPTRTPTSVPRVTQTNTPTATPTASAPPLYNELYEYNAIGNLTRRAGLTYTYGDAAHRHAVTNDGVRAYTYDANGNMLTKGTNTYTWNAENLLIGVGTTETHGYDAHGQRVKRTNGTTTTLFLEGLWEETVGGASQSYYPFDGQSVALRSSAGVLTYLHGDHLGSVSLATTAAGLQAAGGRQEYGPWGTVRFGSMTVTSLDFTGQRRDDSTGLLYYGARFYDPALGRFISADSVVPGDASGGMDGIALKPLTVDFHEPGFVSKLNAENGVRFWFQLSSEQRQRAGTPWGPMNPQTLNRYSYVLNNPIRYVDPTGHAGKVEPRIDTTYVLSPKIARFVAIVLRISAEGGNIDAAYVRRAITGLTLKQATALLDLARAITPAVDKASILNLADALEQEANNAGENGKVYVGIDRGLWNDKVYIYGTSQRMNIPPAAVFDQCYPLSCGTLAFLPFTRAPLIATHSDERFEEAIAIALAAEEYFSGSP